MKREWNVLEKYQWETLEVKKCLLKKKSTHEVAEHISLHIGEEKMSVLWAVPEQSCQLLEQKDQEIKHLEKVPITWRKESEVQYLCAKVQDGRKRPNEWEKIKDFIEENIPVLEKDTCLDWKDTPGFWGEWKKKSTLDTS